MTLSAQELADLDLWIQFSQRAHQGISMNLLTLRTPSQIAVSDSCPCGMGGFTWSGTAWRLKIPSDSPICGKSVANNVLEFLAMAVTLWLVTLECDAKNLQEECIISLGDNTSAIGWLFRAARVSTDSPCFKPVQVIARKVASLVTQSTHCLCAQHLKGQANQVTDWLSCTHQDRDGHPNPLAFDEPDDNALTHRFHLFSPQLIPQNFKMCPLSAKILSFVTHALQITESSMMRWNRRQMKTETGPGDDGKDSASTVTSLTPTSLTFPPKTASSSSVPFSPSIKQPIGTSQADFLQNITRPWQERLSALPQAIWLRRFGTISNRAPFTSKTAPSCSPPSMLC